MRRGVGIIMLVVAQKIFTQLRDKVAERLLMSDSIIVEERLEAVRQAVHPHLGR